MLSYYGFRPTAKITELQFQEVTLATCAMNTDL